MDTRAELLGMKLDRRLLRAAYGPIALGALALLTGCATAGRVFSPGGYGSEGDRFRAAAASDEPARMLAAADEAQARAGRVDPILYHLEEGRLRALAGDLDGSRAAFQRVVDQFEEERAQPVVRVTEGFFNVAALATNDSVLPYASAGFERLMAYNFLALDYLRAGDLERAQISLNGAIAEMDYEREKSAALAAASERRAGDAGIAPGTVAEATAQAQAQLRADALPGLAAYHNAFTFYLQGLIFAMRGDTARSQIALRRAGELAPDHPGVVDARAHGWRRNPDDALIVLLVAEGAVSPKVPIGVPFFWDGTLLQIALPIYPERNGPGGTGDLVLQTDPGGALAPAVICDLDRQARHELADRYAAIFVRQVLRLVAKYQVQQRLQRENPWAGFAAQVFNLLTDQADLRSWSTLPSRLGVAHRSVPAGRHTLRWAGADAADASVVDLPPGGTLVLLVDSFGQTFSQDWVQFDAAGNPAEPAPGTSPQTD